MRFHPFVGDVFVAVDKWKNGRMLHPDASTVDVAAVVFPNAAGAMFLTTITTAIAFFATAIAPVAPIRMFAIFCGLLIMFDYIMNVLLVFPALCIYDEAIMSAKENDRRPNCCIQFGRATEHTSSADEDVGNTDVEAAKEDAAEEESDQDANNKENEKKDSLIRTVLKRYYEILHRLRWVLFILSAAALGISTYYASTFDLPTSSDVRMLDGSNQFEQSYIWRQELLSETLAAGSTAFVIWGVQPGDTGDYSKLSSCPELIDACDLRMILHYAAKKTMLVCYRNQIFLTFLCHLPNLKNNENKCR